MRRSTQEITELVVFALIAILVGTLLLWGVGWVFTGVGWVFRLIAGFIWSLLRFIIPIAIVGGVIFLVVKLLAQPKSGKPAVPSTSATGTPAPPVVPVTPAAPAPQPTVREPAAPPPARAPGAHEPEVHEPGVHEPEVHEPEVYEPGTSAPPAPVVAVPPAAPSGLEPDAPLILSTDDVLTDASTDIRTDTATSAFAQASPDNSPADAPAIPEEERVDPTVDTSGFKEMDHLAEDIAEDLEAAQEDADNAQAERDPEHPDDPEATRPS